MSQESIDAVKRLFDAWAREQVPGPLELLHPDIEYVNPDGAIEPGVRRGLPAFIAAVESLSEGWASWRMEPECFRAAGDRVAVVMSYRARARTSGLELHGRESALVTVRGGKIIRYEWFKTPDAAIEALEQAE